MTIIFQIIHTMALVFVRNWGMISDLIAWALKWPLGVFVAFSTPWAFELLVESLTSLSLEHEPLLYTAVGALLYLWLMVRRFYHRPPMRTAILEHELSHAVFAILTGKGISDMRVTRDEGHIKYYGGYGSWVITAAPYWFPLTPLLAILGIHLAKGESWSFLFFGLSVAFHIHASLLELHEAQTDLTEANFLWCWLFLPSANVMVYAVLATVIGHQGFSLDALSSFSEPYNLWRSILSGRDFHFTAQI